MGVLAQVQGKVRGLFLDIFPTGDEDQQLPLSGQGELLYARGASEYQEIVRQGRAFSLRTTSNIDSVADLNAATPTAHTIAIYNNDRDGGRSIIIDRVWAMFTAQTVATQHHGGMLGLLGQTRVTAPTLAQEAGLVVRKLNGMGEAAPGRVDSVVLSIAAATALDAVTGVAIGWFPLGDSVNTAVVTLPGYQASYFVNGKIIVPPGRIFALTTWQSASAGTLANAAQMGLEWHEKQLLLG